jgi:hypothetical protein
MPGEEIPRSEWAAFCASFSYSHEGWLCMLGRSDVYRPLAAIAAGPVRNAVCAIEIHLGDRPAHIVSDPVRIYLDTNAQGADEGLRIEAADGRTTSLRFRAAAVPEWVDGLCTQAS